MWRVSESSYKGWPPNYTSQVALQILILSSYKLVLGPKCFIPISTFEQRTFLKYCTNNQCIWIQKLSKYLPSMKFDDYLFEFHQEYVDKWDTVG